MMRKWRHLLLMAALAAWGFPGAAAGRTMPPPDAGLGKGGASACGPGRAYVIRPGNEQEVLALLAPRKPGSELTGGWVVGDIRIQKSRVEYAITRGDEEHLLVLYPPTRVKVRGIYGRSPSFVIGWRSLAANPPDEAAMASMRSLVALVMSNDRGVFWGGCSGGGQVGGKQPPGKGPDGAQGRGGSSGADQPEAPVGPAWLLPANQALLALILLLALSCWRGIGRFARDQGARYWLAMAAALALALLLRALLPPQAPLHTNSHGLREMRELISGQEALIPNLLVGQYGLAKQALLAPLVRLLGGTAAALFAINIVLGSLTVVALGVATTRLTRSRLAGAAAALILACLPAHVRLSASESGLVVYNLFFALTLTAAVAALGGGQWRRYLLAALLAAFTAQLHLVALAAPLFVLAAAFTAPGRPRWRELPWLRVLAALALAGVLVAPHLAQMAAGYWQEGRQRGALVGLDLWSSTSNLLFNPGFTPPLLPLLALAGLGLMLPKRWPAAAVWGGGILAFSWLNLHVCACFSDAVRYQTTSLMLVVPPAAWALARLVQRPAAAPAWLRAGMASVITIVLLGSAAPGLQRISAPDNEALEYDFIRRSIPSLPALGTLVLLDEHLASGRVLTDFPDFLLLEQGKRWAVVRQADLEREGSVRRGPLILYHGLSCHSFTDDEVGAIGSATLRPECARFRRRFKLAPLAEARFATRRPGWSARQAAFHELPAERLTFGFYRVDL